MPDDVNIKLHSPSALEKALGDEIQQLLRGVSWLQDIRVSGNPAPFHRAFDWLVHFKVPAGSKVELWIDVRADPRPAHFPYVNIEREFDEHSTKVVRMRVFAAPHLSPRMREICESHGWNWYDLAGNCRISIPGIIHLERTGNPPVHDRPRPTANLGTREAGRVIRALLAPENAGRGWTQRSMELHFGQLPRPIPEPSLGLVNKVVRYLREEAYIEESSKGGFHLRDPLKLLLAWRHAYRFDRHERLDYFTLKKGAELREALWSLGLQTGEHTVYAAFSAAEFQAPHVRQPKTWLYVRNQDLAGMAKLLDAKRVDSGENIAALIPDDDGVFYQLDGGRIGEKRRMTCTNAVQTYVDLWHSGSRGHEAAEAVLEHCLKPRWKDKGLKV
jgi:hypothetical protein